MLFYGPLLQKAWNREAVVEVNLPSQLDESLKCWGHTVNGKDILYEGVHQHCISQDVIHLDDVVKRRHFGMHLRENSTKRMSWLGGISIFSR